MKDEDPGDLPPPDPLFDAIGRVASAWADLEGALGQVLVALLHTPLAGVLTVGQNYSVVYGHVYALLKLPPALEQHDQPRERLSDDLKERLRAELAEADRLSKRRNRIVHGRWFPYSSGNGQDWYSLQPRRHELLTQPELISVTEMHSVARDINATARRIEQIGANIDHRLYGLAAPPGFA
jgi:hypothetical protein